VKNFVDYNVYLYIIMATASSVHVLLIEADNVRSLGGSCVRDIVNMDKYVSEFSSKTNIKRGQTYVLSIDNNPTIQSKFVRQNIVFDKLSNYKAMFTAFTNSVKETDYVVVLVSGHGYQCASKTTEEADRMDEYISHGGGNILDNDIYSLLVSKLYKAKKAVCLADTCHSGTLFDIVNKPNVTNVFSISACLDNQLDSCDIGNNTGFGGSLTVHLLDIDNAMKTLLLGTTSEINALVGNLGNVLKSLGQKPMLCGF